MASWRGSAIRELRLPLFFCLRLLLCFSCVHIYRCYPPLLGRRIAALVDENPNTLQPPLPQLTPMNDDDRMSGSLGSLQDGNKICIIAKRASEISFEHVAGP